MEQRTAEWHHVRLGRLTGSRVADATRTLKNGGLSVEVEKIRAQLIAERLGQRPYPHVVTWIMKRGSELEPLARAAYEFDQHVDIMQAAFIPHPSLPWAGYSPDGLVGEHGLVEFKIPETHNHLRVIRNGAKEIGGDYFKQMQWGMACTGRSWCDFVTFDDRVHDRIQFHRIRVERNDGDIAALEKLGQQFLDSVAQEVEYFCRQYGIPPFEVSAAMLAEAAIPYREGQPDAPGDGAPALVTSASGAGALELAEEGF